MTMITNDFFNRDSVKVAKLLLGKIIRRKQNNIWLSAQIIETEAYCINDKASHSSLGYTEKRKALFMKPGTIYMYYSRGGDSLCISTKGRGNAVLIKSGIVYEDSHTDRNMILLMQQLNPIKGTGRIRKPEKLCSGQTLLCRSLNLKVNEWDGKQFIKSEFYIDDSDYKPETIIQTRRLGIRDDRDAHLPYRFIDMQYSGRSTKDIIRQKNKIVERDYFLSGH